VLTDARSIPHLLQRATRRWGPAIAMRHRKDLARWGIITWSELNHHVSEVAAGLVDLGLRSGDRVALFSATRSDWSICDYGILSVGAVSVPVYHTSTTGQLTYIVNNCEARFLIVDNEARLAQVYEARERMRAIEQVIVMDRLDLRGRDDACTLEDLIRRGRRYLRRSPDLAERKLAELTPDQPATFVYTSGTTGMPKGVVLTHENLLAAVSGLADALEVTSEDVTVLFLPLSHIYGRIGQFLALATGVSTAYAQRIDRLEEVLVEVKPTFVFGVPLVYERIYRAIARRFRELSPLRKKLYHRALESGLGRVRAADERQPALGQRILDRAADAIVFRELRESFGGRLRFAISGGAPLHPSVGEFFRVAGIEILEGYGLTETAAAATLSRLGENRIGSVGRPIPGVRIRIAGDGEVLIRGPNVFSGYHELPADTGAAFTDDGWYRSGDVGWIDSEGRLILTGRSKELLITSGAKNVAPQYVEGALKMSPLISEALVFGDRRPYVVALLDLSPAPLRAMAEELGLGALSHESLSSHEQIVDRVAREVAMTNRRLARYEQVRRWAILPRTLSIGEGGLSHSMKLRREQVAERYSELLDSLYR
jgi:long-chain acyl-CoA synthetase